MTTSTTNQQSTTAATNELLYERRVMAFDNTALTHGCAYLTAGSIGNPLHQHEETPVRYTLQHRVADSTIKYSVLMHQPTKPAAAVTMSSSAWTEMVGGPSRVVITEKVFLHANRFEWPKNARKNARSQVFNSRCLRRTSKSQNYPEHRTPRTPAENGIPVGT